VTTAPARLVRAISLVGMPGSGKSTVGRHVARHLGLMFVDTDHLIEQRIGCSIREYFELHGEPAFRDIEAEVVAETVAADQTRIVATGGGVVLRETNREALRSHSHVFYLRTSADDLARRLRHDTHRPLLQGADPATRLRQLFAERDPIYRRSAHYVIEAPRPSVHALVNMVLMQIDVAHLLPAAEPPNAAP
jgi:shikimate kinase